jgi:ribosomal protein S7
MRWFLDAAKSAAGNLRRKPFRRNLDAANNPGGLLRSGKREETHKMAKRTAPSPHYRL